MQATVDSLKKACLDPNDPPSGAKVTSCFTAWLDGSIKAHDVATAAAIANLYRQISRDSSLADKMAKEVAAASRQVASR